MDWFFRRIRRTTGAVSVPEREPVMDNVPTQGGDRGYIFGESEAEISRLNFQHFMFRYAFGDDFSAPVPAPHSVLDVACGTGRWARDMARRFPTANVIGFDINRDQLDASLSEGERAGNDLLPQNCAFLQGDALQPFAFPAASYELTMARACSAFIPAAQWPHVMREMVRVTRPGGWIEVRDFRLVHSPNAALNELTVKFANMAQRRGIHPGAGPFLKQYLESAGAQDVQVRYVTVRSGVYHTTRAGQLMLADYLALLERVGPGIEQMGIDTLAHWRALLTQARTETRAQPDTHYAEVELTAAFGRRP
jgi:ubiquinone/menaquinone biosynthesis C-methylase UbiE